MKRYIIFAGVNGAGKSTLYRTFTKFQTMHRINTDEILRGFGDWKNTADVMKAGKMAVSDLNHDNTGVFRRIAIYKNGNLVRLSHSIPEWLLKIIN